MMAAARLGYIGPAAHPAVPALRQALQDRAKHVRYEAAAALAKISRDESAIPVLIAQLNEHNWDGRLRSARKFGQLAFRPLMVGRIDGEARLEFFCTCSWR
jgi:HEAT repeat protein